MWTVEQRQTHDRAGLRYPSDVTDAEGALVGPFIPPARRGGRRRTVDMREVLNGIFYILAMGCQWRALPKDLPPKSTAHDYPALWAWHGTTGSEQLGARTARYAAAAILEGAPAGHLQQSGKCG